MISPIPPLLTTTKLLNLLPPPPTDESFTMNASKFQIIYPSYLDSTKSINQGRRIGMEHAVPVPTVSDISLALQSLKIRHVLQPYKGYSRDIETLWENPGRVKVDLANAPFESKRGLLQELAKIIPTLPARQKRLEEEAKARLIQQETEDRERTESQKVARQQQPQQQLSKATTKAVNTNNKKTGKKKR
jgi:signal recognition particle subunit SRP19